MAEGIGEKKLMIKKNGNAGLLYSTIKINRISTGLLIFLLAALCFAACRVPPPLPPPPPAVEIPLADLCQSANHGRRVSVTGYMTLEISFFSHKKDNIEYTTSVLLFAGPSKTELEMLVGSKPNMVEKPRWGFQKGDLRVRTNKGVVGANDLVKVTGTASYFGPSYCRVKVELVESVPEQQPETNANVPTN